MMNNVFAIDSDSTESQNNVKSEFPVYPSEQPPMHVRLKWCVQWRASLDASGYGAIMREQIPTELLNYQPRGRLTEPSDTTTAAYAAIVIENSKIDETNLKNAAIVLSFTNDKRRKIAAKLFQALHKTAPLLLAKLQKGHALKDAGKDSYNGQTMFEELCRESGHVSDYDEKRYTKAYEKLRDSSAPDNCSPNVFLSRFNLFENSINKYLAHPLEGSAYGKFIIGQLPPNLAPDGRTLLRSSNADGTIENPEHVLSECKKLVEAVHEPTKKTASDVEGLAAFAQCTFDETAQSDGSGETAMAVLRAAVSSGNQDTILAAVAAVNQKSRQRRQRAPRADANAATAAAGKEKYRSGYRLPEGERCSKGTCNFAHDKLKPGEPCYRDPRYDGPVPVPTWNSPERMARIEADRAIEAKRLGITAKKLKGPDGSTARPAAAAANLADTKSPLQLNAKELCEMFNASGFMLDVDDDELFDNDDDDVQHDEITSEIESPSISTPRELRVVRELSGGSVPDLSMLMGDVQHDSDDGEDWSEFSLVGTSEVQVAVSSDRRAATSTMAVGDPVDPMGRAAPGTKGCIDSLVLELQDAKAPHGSEAPKTTPALKMAPKSGVTYEDITAAGDMMTMRRVPFEPRIDDSPSIETEVPKTAPEVPSTAPMADLGAGAIARPTPPTAASPIAALEACLSPLAALEAESAATLGSAGRRKPASRAPAWTEQGCTDPDCSSCELDEGSKFSSAELDAADARAAAYRAMTSRHVPDTAPQAPTTARMPNTAHPTTAASGGPDHDAPPDFPPWAQPRQRRGQPAHAQPTAPKAWPDSPPLAEMLGADESPAASAPKIYSSAARFGASLFVVFVLVTLLSAGGYGGLQHQILTLCTVSCFGFRRGMANTFAYAMAPTCHSLEMTAPLPDLWGVLVLLVVMSSIVGCAWWLAEEALLDAAIGLGFSFCRGMRRLLDRQTLGRQMQRHGRTAIGVSSTFLLLMCIFQGAASSVVMPSSAVPSAGSPIGHIGPPGLYADVDAAPSSFYLYDLARKGMNLLPGEGGDRVRFLVDELSISRLGVVSTHSAFLSATETRALNTALNLQSTGEMLTVLDSGAAIDVLTPESARRGAVPGSMRANTLAVRTANGTVVPSLKCDYVLQLSTSEGNLTSVLLADCLIMDKCAHNLVSAGKLARDSRVGLTVGAGSDPSFLTLANAARVPVANLGVLVIPPANVTGAAAAFSAVAQGANRVRHLPDGVAHARGVHRSVRTLRNWWRCADVPQEWCDVKDCACDACLRGRAPDVPSDRHAPDVSKPGMLCSFDIYSLGVKHVHGGQTKVFGVHDHFSHLNWVCLLKNESEDEVIRSLGLYHAYCRAQGVEIRWLHTDNGTSFVSERTRAFVREEIKARYTTTAPYCPRANGEMERQWRSMGDDARRCMIGKRVPRNYAWYALRHSVAVANTLPISSAPDSCALSLFTGKKPNASRFRVWGCVVYAKVYNRVTKMSDQAVRCIHLGLANDQTGYLCYEPESRKLITSVHCRFVETATPGLTLNSEGGWQQVVPNFAEDFDAGLEAFDDTEAAEPEIEGTIVDGAPPPPLVDLDEQAPEPPCAAAPAAAAPPPAAPPAPVAPPPAPPQAPQPPPQPPPPPPAAPASTRPQRARAGVDRLQPHDKHADRRVRRGFLAADSFASYWGATRDAMSPGGKAVTTEFLGLNDTAKGFFYLYLCSGPSRTGDFAEQIKELGTADSYVLNVDTLQGGYAHDLSSPVVASRIKQLAADPNCLGILATIPCSTWSAARFVQPGPEPVRDRTHPKGIPDSEGKISASALKANSLAQNVIEITEAAMAHGAHVVFENPVSRGSDSQFAIEGREEHSSLWDLPVMKEFTERHGNLFVHFDQCRVGASSMKTTALFCSASIYAQVKQRLGHLLCNHSSGHPPILGADDQGGYSTKPAEQFTPELNRLLAESFLAPQPASAGWLASIGSRIEPFSNRLFDTLSSVGLMAGLDAQEATDPRADPHEMVRLARAMREEVNPEDEHTADEILGEMTRLVAAMDHWQPDDRFTSPTWSEAYSVAAVQRNSSDKPNFRQAMNGPERHRWREACDTEMENLARHQIYEEVPEDSLSSWDAIKRRATELIDFMWVLTKKYNEMRKLIKFKARATVRGDMESKVDIKMGLPPAQTFAPTIRHNTLKLMIAAGVVRAAADERAAVKRSATRFRAFDVTAAFLQGEPLDDRPRHIRPPEGYRTYDRRGVPIVWKLPGNCYGRAVAPRIWHKSIDTFLTAEGKDGLGFTRSEADPCYFYKVYPDGSRADLGLYVDDSWLIDNAGGLFDADLARLAERYELKVDESPKQFLGMNVHVESPTRVKLSSEAYILSMADRYVPDWRSRPKLELPCSDKLLKSYETAHARPS